MVGRTISHYRITELLGAGGMGEIYKAQDTRLNRAVAIKVLSEVHTLTLERRRRFLQEAQAASALNHPNIITIYDIVCEGETDFLVMEFVAGNTLSLLIPAGGLRLPLVLSYGVQMADALKTAHAAGIVHRDLKPGNVMVTAAGLVKILDFGLAKMTGPPKAGDWAVTETQTLSNAPLTVEGAIVGTLSYMSPEQAEGKAVDGRSDIFSFGAMLHEMATGQRAFIGDSVLSTLTSILRDEARPITQIAPGLPPALEEIVRVCLRKNRDQRWQSMQEVQAALVALKRESKSGTLIPPPLQIEGPVARSKPRARLALVAAGAVALAGAAAWWAMGRGPQSEPANAPAAPVPIVQTAPAPAAGDATLTNDGVLAMVRAKVAPKLIVEQIHSAKTQFTLSAAEIIRLTEAGTPEEVIEAMRRPERPAPAPAPASAGAGSNAAATTAPAAASPRGVPFPPVMVRDGLPIAIALEEDVPAGAPVGKALRFTVAGDFRVGGTLVVARNAVATGEIVEAARKKLIGGNRIVFRLKEVETVGGGKLALRATSQRSEPDNRRPLEVAGGRKSKDLAAIAGTQYVAYVDGEQTLNVRR